MLEGIFSTSKETTISASFNVLKKMLKYISSILIDSG